MSTHTAGQFDVSLKTWQRWEHAVNPPSIVLQLMRFKAGYLPGWSGFKLRGEMLYTPTNEAVHKNQIEMFWYLVRLKTAGLHLSQPEVVKSILEKINAV